jgi:hypothetical protein
MTRWRKSSHSQDTNCAEVGKAGADVLVRDTQQDQAGPVLAFGPAAWTAFITRLTDPGSRDGCTATTCGPT